MSHSARETSPCNLCELLLRNVAHLLVTCQLIRRSLIALHPECGFSRELTGSLDTVVDLSEHSESQLRSSLDEAGAVLPELSENTSEIITWFIASIPVSVAPAVMAAEVVANLRLLVQHVELKARLAAEEAVLVGQNRLGHDLLGLSTKWRSYGRDLRLVSVRLRAQTYVADLAKVSSPQSA